MRNLRPALYDENQVRAAAGITLAAGTIAFCYAYFQGQFVPIKAVSAIFFVDFVLRVMVGLRFTPSGALSGLLVRHRQPDWVSSSPKRFAWTLGVAISGATAIITNINITGVLPRTLCLICITLMWLEAVLGLCLGCQIYAFAVRRGWIARDDDMVCAGGVCEIPTDVVGVEPRRRVLIAPGR